jgi:hypothetical protein
MNDRELRRVLTGPTAGENKEGKFLFRFVAVSAGESPNVIIERARLVMKCLLEADSESKLESNALQCALPKWFVDRFASSTEGWSIEGWLFAMQKDERAWEWWDAGVLDAELLSVDVLVSEMPFGYDALTWLFRAAGAKSVELEE